MMYSLLRDNKQSGPYSLDQLKTMGLKAYDLVWVDGRSAAWRYPCEIEELKSFSPVVEEQPFDRFFKKPAAASQTASASGVVSSGGGSAFSSSPIQESPATTTSSPLYSGDFSSSPRKRTIYVTMPGGGTPVSNRPAQPEPVMYRQPEPAPAWQADPAPAASNRPMVSEPAVSRPGTTESFSSQPREDHFVEIMPHKRQRTSSRILRPIGVAFCILVLLAAGIFIGLSINKESLGLPQKIASRTGTTDHTPSIAHTTAQQLPAPPVTAPPAPGTATQKTDLTQGQTTGANQSNQSKSLATTEPSVSKPQSLKSIMAAKDKPAGPKNLIALPVKTTDSSVAGIPVVHREAVHRTDPAESSLSENSRSENGRTPEKEAIRASLINQLSVSANKYEVGTFGGISGLQVTVSNRSPYPVDMVVVEVQYIQANKKTYKTENLSFRGIASGTSLMLEAPKSSRGIKVQYKITTINSKELGLTEPGI
jgi:hypothetical protein